MVTILSGSNSFLLRLELKRLVDAFVSEHGDLALERLDGEAVDYNRVHEAVVSLPFLSSKKLVLVRDMGANKALTEHIADLLADVADSTDLIITESKLDKRGVYYKTLQKQLGFKDFGELDVASLAQWTTQTVTEQGGTISRSDASYLVDRIGPSQQLLAGELDKLLLYNQKITKETIDLLVEPSPRSTIFELLEAAFAGNTRRALKLYDEQRQLRVEPQAILALISWQLHILALIKTAGTRSSADIAREGGVSPYVVNKSMPIARRLSLPQLKDLIHQALELDISLKSQPIDADSALQNLLITIASKQSN